jgi:hypothetical protein
MVLRKQEFYKPEFVKPRILNGRYFVDINEEELNLCDNLAKDMKGMKKKNGSGYGGMGGDGLVKDNFNTGLKGEIGLGKIIHKKVNISNDEFDKYDFILEDITLYKPRLKIDMKTRNKRYKKQYLLINKQEYDRGHTKSLDKDIYILGLLINNPTKKTAMVEFYGWADAGLIKTKGKEAEGLKQRGSGHMNYQVLADDLYDMDLFYKMWEMYYRGQ